MPVSPLALSRPISPAINPPRSQATDYEVLTKQLVLDGTGSAVCIKFALSDTWLWYSIDSATITMQQTGGTSSDATPALVLLDKGVQGIPDGQWGFPTNRLPDLFCIAYSPKATGGSGNTVCCHFGNVGNFGTCGANPVDTFLGGTTFQLAQSPIDTEQTFPGTTGILIKNFTAFDESNFSGILTCVIKIRGVKK